MAGSYNGNFTNPEAFNKMLTIEDLGNNKIRISGNNRTPIEMKVQFVSEYTDDKNVMHQTGELAGVFVYTDQNGNVSFAGRKIEENQKLIFFKGTKQ